MKEKMSAFKRTEDMVIEYGPNCWDIGNNKYAYIYDKQELKDHIMNLNFEEAIDSGFKEYSQMVRELLHLCLRERSNRANIEDLLNCELYKNFKNETVDLMSIHKWFVYSQMSH
uniref:Uncharacterized protein n=1 Tax=Acrobeloides nanus TaxID=290746 RepID=A0A914DDI1_9BILA